MLAFQFDMADFRVFGSRLWMQRSLALLEWQWHQLILIIEGVDQTAIGRSGRQELLALCQDEDTSKKGNNGKVIFDLSQVGYDG